MVPEAGCDAGVGVGAGDGVVGLVVVDGTGAGVMDGVCEGAGVGAGAGADSGVSSGVGTHAVKTKANILSSMTPANSLILVIWTSLRVTFILYNVLDTGWLGCYLGN